MGIMEVRPHRVVVRTKRDGNVTCLSAGQECCQLPIHSGSQVAEGSGFRNHGMKLAVLHWTLVDQPFVSLCPSACE